MDFDAASQYLRALEARGLSPITYHHPRSRKRELHVPSHARDSLSGFPGEQSQDSKAFAIGENAASAPKRRLGQKRGAQVHSL